MLFSAFFVSQIFWGNFLVSYGQTTAYFMSTCGSRQEQPSHFPGKAISWGNKEILGSMQK